MQRTVAVLTCLVALAPLPGQAFQPPFAGVYVYTDLGVVPGVPFYYGGVVFKQGDPSKLLIVGTNTHSNTAIYEVDVVRDSQGFLTGFGGTPTLFASAPYADGGLCYGPGGVLFYATYPNNTVGQIKPGSSAPDKITDLTTLGVNGTPGTCNFVPQGFAGAGELKVATYAGSAFHGFTLTPDGNGTYDLVPANGPTFVGGGPEGILYVPPGSALIPDHQFVLVSEWASNEIALFQVDAVGNPILATRQVFLSGIAGPYGACIDPITGDLVFSVAGSGDHVIRVTGFGVCGCHTVYGAGIAGSNGVPTIAGGGCAGRGQVTAFQVQGARPSAAGLLTVGFQSAQLPLLNGTLLNNAVVTFFHLADPTGQWSLSVALPIDPTWNGLNLYSQAWYLDPGATMGASATNGLHTLVR